MAFSGQIIWQSLLSKPECSNHQSIPPLKAQNAAIGKTYEQKFKLGCIRSKKRSLVTLSMLNPDIGKGSFSTSNTIRKYYSSLNNKDLNQLALLISEDCFFHDFSFPQSFQGRKVCPLFFPLIITWITLLIRLYSSLLQIYAGGFKISGATNREHGPEHRVQHRQHLWRCWSYNNSKLAFR